MIIERILFTIVGTLGALILANSLRNVRLQQSPGRLVKYLLVSKSDSRMPWNTPALSHATTTSQAHIDRILRLNRRDISTERFLAKLSALAAVGATAALVGAEMAGLSLDGLLIGVAIGGLLPGVLTLLILERGALRTRASLSNRLPDLLERLSVSLNSGMSVSAALSLVSLDVASPWSPWLAQVVTSLSRGGSLGEELYLIARYLGDEVFARTAELLSSQTLSSELPQLLDAELDSCRRRQRLKLTEILEQRSQLVWIPVSIAILIPGSIILSIPLISSMKFFAGV